LDAQAQIGCQKLLKAIFSNRLPYGKRFEESWQAVVDKETKSGPKVAQKSISDSGFVT
jgi:hypothetical protein